MLGLIGQVHERPHGIHAYRRVVLEIDKFDECLDYVVVDKRLLKINFNGLAVKLEIFERLFSQLGTSLQGEKSMSILAKMASNIDMNVCSLALKSIRL